MKNYRISFDYSAEDPVRAIVYLVGFIEDRDHRDTPVEWIVEDTDTGQKEKITATLNQLEHVAKRDVQKFIGGLE